MKLKFLIVAAFVYCVFISSRLFASGGAETWGAISL